MGINGLIPFLEQASKKANIREFRGQTVAVDTYCWLHKGVYGCAERLARGQHSDAYINYCMKYVKLLLDNNIKPILVFDGRHLPAKAMTEQKRRQSRMEAKKKGIELLRKGKASEARRYLTRCIDVTHEMALNLIKECRKQKVDCIVAPYEADAQLAYLNRENIAQCVITEDSDLMLFGCTQVLFKLDLAGNGLLISAEKIPIAMKCTLEEFSFDKFLHMCILSGCDYLESLPQIGLARACKFVLQNEINNIRDALVKLPDVLKMPALDVTDDYRDEFMRAAATFRHMIVYDPFLRTMVPLTAVGDALQWCGNAGSCLENSMAFQLALGNLDPNTMEKLDDWDPDVDMKSRTPSKSIMKRSIWESYKESDHLLFSPEKRTSIVTRLMNKCESTNTPAIVDQKNLLEMYTTLEPQRKRLCTTPEGKRPTIRIRTDIIVSPPRFSPFFAQCQSKSSEGVLPKRSILQSISALRKRDDKNLESQAFEKIDLTKFLIDAKSPLKIEQDENIEKSETHKTPTRKRRSSMMHSSPAEEKVRKEEDNVRGGSCRVIITVENNAPNENHSPDTANDSSVDNKSCTQNENLADQVNNDLTGDCTSEAEVNKLEEVAYQLMAESDSTSNKLDDDNECYLPNHLTEAIYDDDSDPHSDTEPSKNSQAKTPSQLAEKELFPTIVVSDEDSRGYELPPKTPSPHWSTKLKRPGNSPKSLPNRTRKPLISKAKRSIGLSKQNDGKVQQTKLTMFFTKK